MRRAIRRIRAGHPGPLLATWGVAMLAGSCGDVGRDPLRARRGYETVYESTHHEGHRALWRSQPSPGGTQLLLWRSELVPPEPSEKPGGLVYFGGPPRRDWPSVVDLTTGRERRLPWSQEPDRWISDDALVGADGSRLPIDGSAPEAGWMQATPETKMNLFPSRSRDGRVLTYYVSESDKESDNRLDLGLHVEEQGRAPRVLEVGDYAHPRKSQGNASVGAAFTQDGRRFAFRVVFSIDGNPDVWHRVGVVDLTSGRSVFVDEAADTGGGVRISDGVWDAAGTRFVFLQERARPGSDLYVSNAEGTDVRRVTEDGRLKFSARLSPEGDRAAFWVASLPRDAQDLFEGLALRVLQLRTGEVVDVPIPGSHGDSDWMAWAPDGRSLLFHWRGELDDWEYEWKDEGREGVYRAAAPPPAVVPAGTEIVAVRRTLEQDVAESLRTDDWAPHWEWARLRLAMAWGPEVAAAVRDLIRRARPGNTHWLIPWYRIARALREHRVVEMAPDLVDALERQVVSRPISVIALLMDWGVVGAGPALRKTYGAANSAEGVWSTAYQARFGDESAWEDVLRFAASTDRVARGEVAEALEHVRDPRSVDVLLPLLDDRTRYDDDEIGAWAAKSLAAITGQAFGRDRTRWEAWWNAQERRLPVLPLLPGGR